MNKKQRNKLKKKLNELGIIDFYLYPCYKGYRLRFNGIYIDFDVDKAGLTKSKLEAILEQIRAIK